MSASAIASSWRICRSPPSSHRSRPAATRTSLSGRRRTSRASTSAGRSAGPRSRPSSPLRARRRPSSTRWPRSDRQHFQSRDVATAKWGSSPIHVKTSATSLSLPVVSPGRPLSNTSPLNVQRRLPPLNAVRAFEAAARLGGFNAAGAELNVSANAVGRLVKLLEDSLGVALFRRLPRGVVVTKAGEHYLAGIGRLLDQLAEATADLKRLETSSVLTVSAMPSMVSRWLIPRLGRLTERHPDLDVRLVAKVPRTGFAREEIDVAIRTGAGSYD